ncbi:DUF6457 domain-containing protein [Streptomyces sp. VRA16 Mangrove soil]|uniref:DUF6457 domain-containing protein n=1 Tax=Streptomyces sp. VRA16 Mangrove soil TaxID=2817434 RepID=UPI001A9FD534|nr:DUF6457 domain-containing protein [Streptomyces sp. VRA16 Mangrove soil]MBO1333527.1 NTP transferase domain-containing protein [Streptomyces sp. VRA16 Mangrove soil]
MTEAAAPGRRTVPVYDAVVLAGGAARRLGGADKPGVRVGGRALLDRVLAACAGARATVVVAEPRPTARPVGWAREEPPGGGPLAALGAGIQSLGPDKGQQPQDDRRNAPDPMDDRRNAPDRTDDRRNAADPMDDRRNAPDPTGDRQNAQAETVIVLSADLPFLRERTVRLLLDALDGPGAPDARGAEGAEGVEGVEGVEGALLTDRDGRDQPLVAAYRVAALRRTLDALAQEHGALTGLPLRLLTRELRLARVADPVDGSASFDCDTWDDIAVARSRIREHGHVLDEWISAAKDELGIDLDVDTGVLLDLARDAAHGVARPAAPLTTFLVGYAAAQAGGGPEAVAAAAAKAAALANRWAEEAAASDAAPGDAG